MGHRTGKRYHRWSGYLFVDGLQVCFAGPYAGDMSWTFMDYKSHFDKVGVEFDLLAIRHMAGHHLRLLIQGFIEFKR